MRETALLLAVGIIVSAKAAEISTEDGVLVLTNDNFRKVIDSNEFVLVEFYAPWCGHCKALAPEYAKAAGILQENNSKIKLAKVDAQEHRELGDRNGIRGYPTLKFFRQGNPVDYKGGREAGSIVDWVEKKAIPPAIALGSSEEIKKFVDNNEVVVIGFFKDQDTKEAKNFFEVANAMDDINFGIVTDTDAFIVNKVTNDGVVLFKAFDEGRNDYVGAANVDELETFIRTNSLPLLIDFKPQIAPRLFAGEVKSALFLFVSTSSKEFLTQKEMAGRIAKDFRGKVMTLILDVDDESLKQFLDLLGMSKDDVPGMRLMHGVKDTYGPEFEGIDEDNVRQFLQDYLDRKLAPRKWLKSEEIPIDWDKEAVKVLVGRNFHDVVNNGKTVFVKFYAPWCGFCKQLAPTWEELGEKFKYNEKVIIAKMDATVNELDSVAISSYPTVLIFKGSVEKKVDCKERTLEKLINFLRAHGVKLEDAKDIKDEL